MVLGLILLLSLINDKYVLENFDNRIKINDVVDCIYILNLDKDIERMKKLSINLKKKNIKFKRISGVLGSDVHHKYNTKLRPGQLGCLLSHFEIIRDAKYNNYNKILILEDDIVFDHNFEDKFSMKYKNFISNEKDYDILYLGCSQASWGIDFWKYTKNYGNYYSLSKTDGTYAMILSSSIFDNILSYDKFDKPIDVLLSELVLSNNKYKRFSLYPHIISSNVADVSNTDSKRRDMKVYLKKNRLNPRNFI